MITVDTRLGPLTGTKTNGVSTFLGIPFAQPPLGDLRFRAPLPITPWTTPHDGTRWGHQALQPESPIMSTPNGTQNENCLVLNVYTPAAGPDTGGTGSRPVLVWIHGGAFTMGSANQYDGSVLVNQGNVVVVTVNYRLGLLGFLDLSAYGEAYAGSASNGIRDQILALEWVRENIADYGGDPGNVTIFGESAGGHSVNAVIAAPAADGLYHRAIAHSGGTPSTPPADFRTPLSNALGIAPDELLGTLLGMPAADVLALQIKTGIGGSGSSVDGVVVTRPTEQAMAEKGPTAVPYIAGSNHDEGTLFSSMGASETPDFAAVLNTLGRNLASATLHGADPDTYIKRLQAAHPDLDDRGIYERIWLDMFRRASIDNAEAATAAGAGGWLYRFDLPSTAMGGALGATHGCEIAFTFNSFVGVNAANAFHDGDDPIVRDLARRWSDTVLVFARTGNPNGAGLPEWPSYSDTDRMSLVLDAESWVADAALDADARALWGT